MKYLLTIFLSLCFLIGCEKKKDKKVEANKTYCHFSIQRGGDEFRKVLNQKITPLKYFKSINHSNPEMMNKNLYGKNMEQYTRFGIVDWFKFYNGIGDTDLTNKYLNEWAGLIGAFITWNDCDENGVKQSYYVSGGIKGIEVRKYPLNYLSMMMMAIHFDSKDERDYKILLHLFDEVKKSKNTNKMKIENFVIVSYGKHASYFGNGKLTMLNFDRMTWKRTFLLSKKPFNNFDCDDYGIPKELFIEADKITSQDDIFLHPFFGKNSKAVTLLLRHERNENINKIVVMDTKSKKYKVLDESLKCGMLPKELLRK